MKRRFALWIFDLDGVLVDTSSCHAQAYHELWERIGIDGPAYETVAGRKTREVIRNVTQALSAPASSLDEWVRFKQERARAHIADGAVLFDDVGPALDCLASAGTPMALGTSASRANATATLDRFDLARHFKEVVTGDDVIHGKPAPDIYTAVMRACGYMPTRSLVVEDSAAGVASALAAGAWVAVVRSGLGPQHERLLGSFPDVRAVVAEAS